MKTSMRRFERTIKNILEAEQTSQDKMNEMAQGIATNIDAMIKMDQQLDQTGSNYASIQNSYINQLTSMVNNILKTKATEMRQTQPQQQG
jgi:hypothetical protein